MAVRTMMFIDGTWLAATLNRLAEQAGYVRRVGGPIDFGALPVLCSEQIRAQIRTGDPLDVVRTHYFASVATNYDPVDHDAVQRRLDFFDSLRRQHRYEVYRYEIDYRGHRVRRSVRDDDTPGEPVFEPREKAVDVGLATTLLEMTALSAFDIAIVVAGDRDFVPALQAVRRLGKRVAIVTARGSCPREFHDPNDPLRLRDFDPVWIDELWPALASSPRLVRTTDVTEPESVESVETVVPRAEETATPSAPLHAPLSAPSSAPSGQPHEAHGRDIAAAEARSTLRLALSDAIVTKVHDSGYAFARDDHGHDYFFRRESMAQPTQFEELRPWRSRVSFDVEMSARYGKAGRASRVVLTDTDTSTATYTDASRRLVAPVVRAATAEEALWDVDPFAPPPRH